MPLSTTSPTTVYVSADLAIQPTIEDSGNFEEINVPVTLTVKVGGKKLLTQRKVITSIQPAQQTTLSFTGLQLTPEAFGHSATITIDVAAVPGEQKLDNNTATYPVFFTLSQP